MTLQLDMSKLTERGIIPKIFLPDGSRQLLKDGEHENH
jgi:hypothetical protein